MARRSSIDIVLPLQSAVVAPALMESELPSLGRRLIEERGFNIIVLEAEWPAAYRINRYIDGQGKQSRAEVFGGPDVD